jgi:histidinol-phosphate phosphatase family protein
MVKRKYNWYWRIEFVVVMVPVKLLRLLPWWAAEKLAAGLAWILFYLIPRRRRITIQNLKQAFRREKNSKEIRSLAKESYRHLAYVFVEFCKAGAMESKEITSRVQIEGAEYFNAATAQGRGVIAITSHLGNWELGNMAHAIHWTPPNVLARPLDNPYLNDFVNRQRQRFGNRIINSKSPGAIRDILKALNRGEWVGFMMDQNVRGDRGVFVDYFGKVAYTHKVVALIAQRTGAPVVPTFIIRKKDRTHQLIYGKPMDIAVTGDRDRDLVVNTQRMTRTIESYIRKHPEQWLWIHDRWKKQPKNKEVSLSGRAVFLDRDGTITKEIGYVHDIEKFELMEHSAEAIRLLNARGIKVIVATNQSGVARGYFSETHVQSVNKRLEELLAAKGAHVDEVFYCPHHPTEGQESHTFSCDCRKPNPGLLYRAEEKYALHLSQSFVVGDKLTDISLAHRVGAKAIMVLTGYGREELGKDDGSGITLPDFVASDLLSAVHWILKELEAV